jgi:2-oxoglutarate dehydrogenase E2 component (dihydrolipoamide succinyltransferase)
MSLTVTMPQLGETVTEGTILSWAKQVGDSVVEDEVLVEISTDKVDTEMPSPAAGIITEILVDAGETVEVGTPIAVIGESMDATSPDHGAPPVTASGPAPESQPASEPAAPPVSAMGPTGTTAMGPTGAGDPAPSVAPPPSAATTGTRRAVLSPVVRRLAAEHDVDLDLVTGTGDGGRITRKDIERYVATPPPAVPQPEPEPQPEADQKAAAESAPPPAPAPAPPMEAVPVETVSPAAAESPPVAASPPPAATTVTITAGSGEEVTELPRLRRTIAEHMIRAKQTAAHVWTSVEVDYERVEQARLAQRAQFKADEGFSLTYLPFIARATMDALAAFPVVNSSLDLEAGTRINHKAVHLGIAVDLASEGLLVATVRDADGQTLKRLARNIRTMAVKTRDGDITPDEISGSTFTITNPGPFGSFMSAPIINLPNVAILSTDTIAKRPAVVSLPDGTDTIAVRHIGYLGLTWDHRAFDGSTAVLFLDRIRTNLETWDWDQELR